MFEKLLTEVLNKVLGKFITNIDPKQLSVSLTSGRVKLENMKIKPSLFDALPVPFKLVWGQIGTIDLHVPITKIFSLPLEINISDIYGIIRPKDFSEWDTNVEEQAFKEQTQNKLDEFEIFKTQKDEISKDPSSIDKLVQKIIDNIQIKIMNVCFRYEDSITASNQGSGTFIIGILLKEVSIFSSLQDWKEIKGVIDSSQDLTYKVGRIKGLSIYLDFINEKEDQDFIQNKLKLTLDIDNSLTNVKELEQDTSNKNFLNIIQKEFEQQKEIRKSKNREDWTHYNILDSFSMEIRAQINKNPKVNEKPQIELSILLGGQYKNMEPPNLLKNLSNQEIPDIDPILTKKVMIKLNIRQPQIMRIMKLLEFIGYYNEFQDGARSKFTSRPISQALANEYIRTYVDWKLINGDKKQAKQAEEYKKQMVIIEDQYPYQKILVLRKLGIKMIDQKESFKNQDQDYQKQMKEIQNEKKSTIFTSKQKKLQNQQELEEFKFKLEQEIKQKQRKQISDLESEMITLTSQLGDQKTKFNDADMQSMPVTYVRFKMKVELPLLVISYVNEYHSPIFTVYFNDQMVDLTIGGAFMTLQFIIQSFRIEDQWTGASAFPNIIETRLKKEDQQENQGLFEEQYAEKKALIFKYETGPHIKIAPFRITVENQTTLFIVVNWILIKEIIRSLASAFKGEKLDFTFYKNQSQQMAVSYMKAGKELVEMMKKGEYDHHGIDLHIVLKAPVVMLCDNIFYPKKQIVVVDAGLLKLETTLIKHDDKTNYKALDKADQVFDRYECTLTQLRLLVMVNGLPNGFESYRKEDGNHVIKDFNAIFNVYNAHDPFHPSFPTIEFVTIFKNVEFEFGKEEVMYITRIVVNLLERIKVKEQKLIDNVIISKRKFKHNIQKRSTFIADMRKQLDKNYEKNSSDSEAEFFDALEENSELIQKKAMKKKEKEEQSRVKIIQEEKQLAEKEKQEELRPSWRMYFSVDRLQITFNEKEYQLGQMMVKDLFYFELLFFGFELEYDKKGNLNINIGVFKFTIFDTQQDEQIAHPFRMILSSPLVEYQKKKFVQQEEEEFSDTNTDLKQNQYMKITSEIPKVGSIIQRSLVYLPEFSKNSSLSTNEEEKFYDSENQGHFVDEFSFKLHQIKGETTIYCQLTDIRLIVSMTTLKQVVKMQIEITEVVKMISDEKYNNRVRRMRIYDQIVKNMDKTYEEDEYKFYRQVVINFYQHSGLNLKEFQDALREGTSKLQELWDYPEREFQILRQFQMLTDVELNDVSDIETSGDEKEIKEQPKIKRPLTSRIEKSDSNLIIEAKLNNLSIWIPLKPSDCKCQIASLSFISDFNYTTQGQNECIIDCEFNQEISGQQLQKKEQLAFSINQFVIQTLTFFDENSFYTFQPQQKDLLKKQTMLTPSRITLKMDSISRNLEKSKKMSLSLAIEPMHFKIGFQQIDFVYIFLAQVQNFVLKQYESHNKDQENLFSQTLTLNELEEGDSEFFQIDKGQNTIDSMISKKKRKGLKRKRSHKKNPQPEPKKESNESKFPKKRPKIESTTIKFVCEILTVSLIDDSDKLQFEQPLINLSLNNVTLFFKNYYKQDDAATFILKKMGVYQKLYPKTTKDQIFLNLTAGTKFQIFYYNTRNLALEPLIEPWSIMASMEQESKFKPKILNLGSQYMLGINLTYGMALTFRKIVNRLENSELKAKMFIEEYLKTFDNEDQDELNKSRTSSTKSKLKIHANQTGFIFQNFTGLNLKFCIHDQNLNQDLEYTQEENKQGLSLADSTQRTTEPQLSQSKLTLNRVQVLQAFDDEDIFKTYDDMYQNQKEVKQRQSNGRVVENLDEEPIKIDLKLDGLEKLVGVPIEGIGIYSYNIQLMQYKTNFDASSTMINQTTNTTQSSQPLNQGKKLFGNIKSMFKKDIQQLTPMEEIQGRVGVICNIKMNGLHKQVILESQLLIANNHSKKLKLLFMEYNQAHPYIPPNRKVELEQGDIYRVPLSFFINEPPLSIFLDTGAEQKILLFQNFAQYFTYKHDLSKMTSKISQIIQIGADSFMSIDVQGYKCLPQNQTINPTQYLLSFNPPLTVNNYNFSPLEIFDMTSSNTLAQITPKCIKHITQIDPIKGKSSLKWIFYEQEQIPIQCFTNLFSVENKVDTVDQKQFTFIDSEQAKINKPFYLQFEFRNNYFQDYLDNDYNENFELRQKVVNFVSSTSLIIYPKYMLINKTMSDIICQDQIISAFTNNYLKLTGSTKTVPFKISGYKNSPSFAISTIGIAGSFGIDLEKAQNINLDQLPQQYVSQKIDFGLTIEAAPNAFSKTTLIQIVPRFVLVNKLNRPLVIRQRNLQQQILIKAGDKIPYNFEQKGNPYISVRAAELDEVATERLSTDKFQDSDQWSAAFPIEDIDDFQIQYQENKKIISNFQNMEEEQKLLFLDMNTNQQQQIWYEPNSANNYRVFTRVIITTQDDATIFVVFTNPMFPEYEIHNKTEDIIECSQIKHETLKQKMKIKYKYSDITVGNMIAVLPKQHIPYAWQDRIQNKMKLLIKIDQFEEAITLDKAKKLKVIDTNSQFKYQIEVKVKGNTKILKIKKVLEKRALKALKKNENFVFTNQNGIIDITVNLKGIGISLIDDVPREILFLSIYNLNFNYQKWIETRAQSYIETSQKFYLQLKHLQIDNMTGDTIPVILAPLKILNKQGHNSQEEQKFEELDDQYTMIESTPFIQINLQVVETTSTLNKAIQDQTTMIEDQRVQSMSMLEQSVHSADLRDSMMGSTMVSSQIEQQSDEPDKLIRLKSFQISIQEFLFKLDTAIVNNNVKFVEEILSILLKQKRFKPQLTNSFEFEKAKSTPKDELCDELNAIKPLLSESKNIQSNKIFIEYVNLGAIKANISVRLEKKAFEIDITSPGRAFGAGNFLQNFLASAATITDSPLQFKQLIILDTFATTEQFTSQLSKNYIRQAVLQFYKFLGSSDLIGNPLGLVDKLGTGVFEFFSEPQKGMLQGPEQFIGGIGKGVKGLVSNVVGGGFDSVSKISGSLYSVVKNAQGEQNIQLKKPDHALDGIYQGVKGGALEIYGGVKGVFVKPVQGGKEKGATGALKGVGSGLLGAITAPLSAGLRVGSSITSGVAQTASSLGNKTKDVIDSNSQFARFRAPRYINLKAIIQPYNEELSVVSQLMAFIRDGYYVNESIKFYCSVPECNSNGIIQNQGGSHAKGQPHRAEQKYNDGGSLIIITDQTFLYVKVEQDGKKKGQGKILFKSSLKSIQKCEVFKSSNTSRTNEDEFFYYMIIQSQKRGKLNQQKKKEYKFISKSYQKFERIYDKLAIIPQIQVQDRIRQMEQQPDNDDPFRRCC